MKKQEILDNAGNIVKVAGTGRWADPKRLDDSGPTKTTTAARPGVGRLTGRTRTASIRYWSESRVGAQQRSATFYEVEPVEGDADSVSISWWGRKPEDGQDMRPLWVEGRYVSHVIGSDADRALQQAQALAYAEAKQAGMARQRVRVDSFRDGGYTAQAYENEGVTLRLSGAEADALLRLLLLDRNI